ncbi:MAG: S16 family serine protease [Candidatus Woesearchaeota archaeon]
MKITSKERIMLVLAVLATVSITIALVVLSRGIAVEEDASIISGSMPLLAVSTGPEARGGIAYLDLKIIEGTGSVYVHAEPFTRVDTQATTRFAKQYACAITEADCTSYDFLYSIRSDSPIVGGPSAGAAMAALTISLLEGKEFPAGVSITGSISSGGIIGNVGGIAQKVEAAQRAGLRTVVIPTISNYTADNNLRIRVVAADTVEEALRSIDPSYSFALYDEITVPESYTNTMRSVAQKLCGDNIEQYNDIMGMVLPVNPRINNSITLVEELIENSHVSESEGLYYTQASHCFNARTRLHYLRLSGQMINIEDDSAARELIIDILEMATDKATTEYNRFLRASRNDINSIQIKSIVKERYDESIQRAEELISEFNNPFSMLSQDDILFEAGYILARIDSMISWMTFTGYDTQSPQVSASAMRALCNRKISEANERAEYVEYATGIRMIDISDAYSALSNRDYDECIYKASLSKARADMIMSRISTPPDRLGELLDAKRAAAEHAIAMQSSLGVFPVMAYSYLEYANSLGNESPEIALLYYENAIELSGLSSYFDEEQRGLPIQSIITNRAYLFFIFTGLALGFSISMIIMGSIKEKRIMDRKGMQLETKNSITKPKTKTNTIKRRTKKTTSKSGIKLKKIARK